MRRFLETAFDEGRRAVRTLWRAPLFTLCVLGLLTIAIGTVTSLGAASAELLHARLPYAAPGRLAMVWSDLPRSGYTRAPLSGPELIELRQRIRGLSGVAAMFPGDATLNQGSELIRISTLTVTSNFFDVLGVPPALGRTFRPEDEGPAKPFSVILSWETWQERFGGDRSVIGRMVDVGARNRFEIIGVMPPSFRMVFPPDANIPSKVDVWRPFGQNLSASPRHRYFVRVFGRVRDNTTVAAVSAEVRAMAAELTSQFPAYQRSGRTLYLVGLGQDLSQPVRTTSMALLSAGLVLVLLVAISLSGLWLARAVTQGHEHAIHQMLGASRGRVWSHLLAQAVVLAVVGSGLGMLAGLLGLAALRWIRPLPLVRIDYATLTAPVIAAIVGIVVASTLLLAVVSRVAVTPFVGVGLARTRIGAAPRRGFRTVLVVGQVALALVFLISSALWTRTLINVVRIDPGFQPAGAVTFRFGLNAIPQPTDGVTNEIVRQLTDAVKAIPGVTDAGTISHLPFDHFPNWAMPYTVEVDSQQGTGREADARPVSAGFLNAVGARLRAGRFFDDRDDVGTPPVVVVDELLASRTWPGEDPIGKPLRIHTTPSQPYELRTVIGVLQHIRYRAVEMQVREQVFLPFRQFPRGPYAFIVRTSGDVLPVMAAIRERVRQVDARIPVWDVRPLQEYYQEATAERRFTAGLMVSFAVASLTLASLGVYGLLAYIVASRRVEFGVRLALGAERHQVVRAVLREGLQWAAIGILIGALAMAVSIPRLSTALYGVAPFDPLSWLGAVVVLLAVVALASWLPALRAGRTDPAHLMKSQ